MNTKPLSTLPDAQIPALLQALAGTDPDFQQHIKPLTDALQGLSMSNTAQLDLARESLAVLAEDPAYLPRLQMLQDDTGAQSYGVVSSLAAVTAMVFLLRSHIKLELDSNGKMRFHFEHKPADNKLMITLLEKLKNLLK